MHSNAVLDAVLISLFCIACAAAGAGNGTGLIIANPPGNDTWYALKVSHPVVLRFGPEDYRMWAYGCEFGASVKGAPFTRTGYFTSKDGVSWDAVKGPDFKGSVLSPVRGTGAWDSGALGVSDVFYLNGTFYQMYSGTRDTSVIGANETLFGFLQTMRAGVAVSPDGIHWTRCQGAPQNFGASFAGSPPLDLYPITPHLFIEGYNASALQPPPPSGLPSNTSTALDCTKLMAAPLPGPEIQMLYHSVKADPASPAPSFQEYSAVGSNFFNFSKQGALAGLEKGSAGAFDSGLGVAEGRMLKVGQADYLLFYEGSGVGAVDSIGLARSSNGRNWTKDVSCTGKPGGPVLSPTFGTNTWDNFTIGTPFPVLQPNGTIYLYYVGFSSVLAQGTDPSNEANYAAQIGMAVSQLNSTGGQDYCNFKRV